MKKHKQVQVKVNALVDEKIAELVSVLSAFDGVFTYESCESSFFGAYVCFRYGSPSRPSLTDTMQFANFLAKVVDDTDCIVSVEWLPLPTIVLTLPPDTITIVCLTLACHKIEYSRDRRGKAPDN